MRRYVRQVMMTNMAVEGVQTNMAAEHGQYEVVISHIA